MNYFIVATKSEAQPFVERYRLTKSKISNYTRFSNESISILISGIGWQNCYRATLTFLDATPIMACEKIINVGICGAPKSHSLGALLEIGQICFEDRRYILNPQYSHAITCVDAPQAQSLTTPADMES